MIAINKSKKLLHIFMVVFLIIIIFIFLLFAYLNRSYQEKVKEESATHLYEIANQVKTNLEERINQNWTILNSLVNMIEIPSTDLDEITSLLANEVKLRDLKNICIYNTDGYCLKYNGDIENNNQALTLINDTLINGYNMNIIQSTITYTLPIETTKLINGKEVIAISMSEDIGKFINKTNFLSFDKQAILYLTDQNGTKISQLSTGYKEQNDNIFTSIKVKEPYCVNDESITFDQVIDQKIHETFIFEENKKDNYCVVMPVDNKGNSIFILYIVPEYIVNSVTNQLYKNVLITSIIFVIIFILIICVCFWLLVRDKQNKYNQDIASREQMIDLLIENTKYAFALLVVGKSKLGFVSKNANRFINNYIWLDKQNDQYLLQWIDVLDHEIVETLNEQIKDWDGKTEFTSTYIPYQYQNNTHYLLFSLFPVSQIENNFIAIINDVTKDYENEQILKNTLKLSNSANTAKSRFLANMSHDIRTPMNAIVNMTNFAIDNIDEPYKVKYYLRIIKESSQHLLELINNILDVSRIESGDLTFDNEPFDLFDCIVEVAELIRPLTNAKDQTLITEFSEISHDKLIGDRLKIKQILINILNNAYKFTPNKGEIIFQVKENNLVTAPNTTSITFIIKDNGPGIAKNDLNKIFEPFARSTESEIRTVEGSGLGLSICKSYVEAMGGKIECFSEPKHGSSFIINLSFMNVSKDVINNDSLVNTDIDWRTIRFTNKYALLCEDNEINTIVASQLLISLGFKLVYAKNGQEAVIMYEKYHDKYDVIYMDIQMPIMDGYMATYEIRNQIYSNALTIPIIAMTANVFVEDVDKVRLAGMNAHIAKPIMMEELVTKTNKLINK